jgi:hypothetical protein
MLAILVGGGLVRREESFDKVDTHRLAKSSCLCVPFYFFKVKKDPREDHVIIYSLNYLLLK